MSPTLIDDPTAEAATERESSAEPLPWYARQAGIGWILLVTGVISMVATLVLFYERIMLWQDPNHIASCDLSPWVSCGTIMESWQAGLFGFPNHFIGIIGFTIVITLAVLIIAGVQLPRWIWGSLQVGIMGAGLFCLWLWIQAVYYINALCLYCMIVWTAVIPMTFFIIARNVLHSGASLSVKRTTANLVWPAIIITYVIVGASIVLRFGEAMF